MDERMRKGLPFYMAYPMPLFYEEEDTVVRDLEYLLQMYPDKAKRYHRAISQVLDRIDYSGSLIYDEFPDRFALQRLAGSIAQIIEKEDETKGGEQEGSGRPSDNDRELILILLYYEIYRRRHDGSGGFLKF